jgi:hypothetical protein
LSRTLKVEKMNIKTIIQSAFTILFLTWVSMDAIGQDNPEAKNEGIYFGLTSGTWFGDDENRIMGNPFMLGFTLELHVKKNVFGLNYDILGTEGKGTDIPLDIKHGDSILQRNHYFGAQLSIDYGRKIWHGDRMSLEAICGIGYGNVSYYNPDAETDIDKSSFLINPGLGVRVLIGKKFFLLARAQYYIANYSLDDGTSTSLKGNYLNLRLCFGRAGGS